MLRRKKKQSVLEWGIDLIERVFPSEYDPDHDPCFSKIDSKKPSPVAPLSKKEQWLLRQKNAEPATQKKPSSSVGLFIPDGEIRPTVKKTAAQLIQEQRPLDMEEIDRRTAEMNLVEPGSGSIWKHRMIKDYEARQRIQAAKTFAKASVADRLSMSSGGHAYMSGMDVFNHAAFDGSEFINDLGNIPCSRLDGTIATVLEPMLEIAPATVETKKNFTIPVKTIQANDPLIGTQCPISWDTFAVGDKVGVTPCCKKVLSASVLEELQSCPCCHR